MSRMRLNRDTQRKCEKRRKCEIEPGEEEEVVTGREMLTVCAYGRDYQCRIRSITPEEVHLDVVSSELCAAEPSMSLTLYQAVPKADKLEQIIQKSVELGVTRIVPVLTRRCISRPKPAEFQKKLPRLGKRRMMNNVY